MGKVVTDAALSPSSLCQDPHVKPHQVWGALAEKPGSKCPAQLGLDPSWGVRLSVCLCVRILCAQLIPTPGPAAADSPRQPLGRPP